MKHHEPRCIILEKIIFLELVHVIFKNNEKFWQQIFVQILQDNDQVVFIIKNKF